MLQDNASFMVFSYGDVIYSIDEQPKGIFVIVSGLVKVEYIPSPENLEVKMFCQFKTDSYIHT